LHPYLRRADIAMKAMPITSSGALSQGIPKFATRFKFRTAHDGSRHQK
jgi:hypothetical protein